jgi:hypothetical protein
VGDFDAHEALDVVDIDMLTAKIQSNYWLPDDLFDLNSDTLINKEDHRIWIKDPKKTWIGDANLDIFLLRTAVYYGHVDGMKRRLQQKCSRDVPRPMNAARVPQVVAYLYNCVD